MSLFRADLFALQARRRILAPAKPPAVSATTTEPYRLAAAHHGLGPAHLAAHHMQPPHLSMHHSALSLGPHHGHMQSHFHSSHMQSPQLAMGAQFGTPHHLQGAFGPSYPHAHGQSHLQSSLGGHGGHGGAHGALQSVHGHPTHATRAISSLYTGHAQGHPHSLPLPLPHASLTHGNGHGHASLHAQHAHSAHPSSHAHAGTGMYAPSHMVRRVASEDSLRLYEPASSYGAAQGPGHSPQEYPRYAAAQQAGRLAYPAATVGSLGSASPAEYTGSGGYGGGGGAMFGMPSSQDGSEHSVSPQPMGGDVEQQQQREGETRDETPRYFGEGGV